MQYTVVNFDSVSGQESLFAFGIISGIAFELIQFVSGLGDHDFDRTEEGLRKIRSIALQSVLST